MIKELQQKFFSEIGFHKKKDTVSPDISGVSYKLDTSVGDGDLWYYSVDNLYSISVHNVFYNCNISVPVQLANSSFLFVGLGRVIPGQPNSKKTTDSDQLITHNLEDGIFLKQIKRNTVEKFSSVCITPEFYTDLLKVKYPEFGMLCRNGTIQLTVNEYVPEIACILNQLSTFRPFNAIARAYYDSKVTELLCMMAQWELKRLIFPTANSISDIDREHLEEIFEYLNNNYHNNISIDELAKQACMSRSKLAHLFKQVYGTTMPGHIKALRINRAKELLANTSWKIETVSNEVGYKLHGSFTEAFKQATGCTPHKFRENALQSLT